ncbi:efflux RND transporter periplasmic adaptor subunit [Pleurocapsales cyanobacterium LEGE 10410]|nr:efflux RND transporter periplasmic adaptor subunit [Pleurocapsales cyanobacterium LEGE 10410]
MLRNRAIASKTLGASLLFLVLSCGEQQPEAQAPPPVTVEIEDLDRSQVRASSEFVGNLEAQQRVALAPRVDGRITEIVVQEGDTVEQGDLIVQLQLNREQGEVEAAQSEVGIQQANVNNAEAELRTAEAEVAAAAAAVEQSQADLREQEAELELAQTNLERTRFLVKEGAQSQQILDDRTRDLNAAQAQRDALRAALNSSQKALNASRERVSSARAAIAGQQAALRQAESRVGVATENLGFNRIVAPIAGVVGDIQPKVGDYVEAGEQVTSIVQDDALELNVGVPLEQASRLELGLPVEIVDLEGEAIAEGDISFISPRTDRSSQAILVKATFNNNGRLRDDSFARARIIWSEEPGVLIPTEAVSRIAGKSFVFVAEETEQEDGSTALVAKQKPVELGAIQGQSYQVISGLETGDRLITSGILNLADGTPIAPESVTSQEIE